MPGAERQDLVMHYLVTRRAGLALVGPPADQAFGEVPRGRVLPYLGQELAWGLDHADAKYAVLYACRALAYAVDSKVLSKVAGGRWALGRGYNDAAINRALAAQTAGFCGARHRPPNATSSTLPGPLFRELDRAANRPPHGTLSREGRGCDSQR
jgi:hypothetical protein